MYRSASDVAIEDDQDVVQPVGGMPEHDASEQNYNMRINTVAAEQQPSRSAPSKLHCTEEGSRCDGRLQHALQDVQH